MSKIYETTPLHAQVGGDPVVLSIPFPSRVTVSKLIVVQSSGTPEDFTVELFNHASVLGGGFSASSPTSPDGTGGFVPEDVFRVCMPQPSGPPGRLVNLDAGFTFYSHEESADRPTVNRRIIYMRITPSTPAAKTFVVLLGAKAEE